MRGFKIEFTPGQEVTVELLNSNLDLERQSQLKFELFKSLHW